MESIKLHSHIGLDGVLRLKLPEDLKDRDVTVIIQPADPAISASKTSTSEESGWLAGFFEEVIGGWEGEPLVRPEQPELETRDELQ